MLGEIVVKREHLFEKIKGRTFKFIFLPFLFTNIFISVNIILSSKLWFRSRIILYFFRVFYENGNTYNDKNRYISTCLEEIKFLYKETH